MEGHQEMALTIIAEAASQAASIDAETVATFVNNGLGGIAIWMLWGVRDRLTKLETRVQVLEFKHGIELEGVAGAHG